MNGSYLNGIVFSQLIELLAFVLLDVFQHVCNLSRARLMAHHAAAATAARFHQTESENINTVRSCHTEKKVKCLFKNTYLKNM